VTDHDDQTSTDPDENAPAHPGADTPSEDVEPAFDLDLDPEDQGTAGAGAEPSA